MAGENKTIGKFNLDGIAPAPRGIPQIDVMFDIDANGILSVSATDKATGKEQRITITASSGLAKDEVERLVKEAEAHAEEDKRRRELVEVRNLADSAAYQAERTLAEFGEQISADLKSEVEGKIADVRAVLVREDADVESLNAAVASLQASLQKIGEQVYQQQQAEAEAAAQDPADDVPPSDDSSGGDAIEGEYREV